MQADPVVRVRVCVHHCCSNCHSPACVESLEPRIVTEPVTAPAGGPAWLETTETALVELEEADLVGLLAEASAAHEQVVLPDQTAAGSAHAAARHTNQASWNLCFDWVRPKRFRQRRVGAQRR
jgi:hypothetical protein